MPALVAKLLPVLVLSVHVSLVVTLLWWISAKKSLLPLLHWFYKHTNILVIIIVIAATLGSLFYSEVMGLAPCKLCWYQRILMYPQVIILIIAWRKKLQYSLEAMILSGLGAVLAGYHYVLQISAVPDYLCSAVGYSASCAEKFEMGYGYITIPLMAMTAFALVFGLSLLNKLNNNDHH